MNNTINNQMINQNPHFLNINYLTSGLFFNDDIKYGLKNIKVTNNSPDNNISNKITKNFNNIKENNNSKDQN